MTPKFPVNLKRLWHIVKAMLVFVGIVLTTIIVSSLFLGCTVVNKYALAGTKTVTQTVKCDTQNPVEVNERYGYMCTHTTTYHVPVEMFEQFRATSENIISNCAMHTTKHDMVIISRTMKCDAEHVFTLHETTGVFCTITTVFHRARNAAQRHKRKHNIQHRMKNMNKTKLPKRNTMTTEKGIRV